jgi:hypothetical protein
MAGRRCLCLQSHDVCTKKTGRDEPTNQGRQYGVLELSVCGSQHEQVPDFFRAGDDLLGCFALTRCGESSYACVAYPLH